jgi:hypothetical protein
VTARALGPLLFLGLTCPAWAQDAPSEPALVQVALDERKPLAERAEALRSAVRLVRGGRGTDGPLRPAVGQLLDAFAPRAGEREAGGLISAALRASDLYAPYPALERRLAPYLLKGSLQAQTAALDAAARQSAKVGKVLARLVGPGRTLDAHLELRVVEVARRLPDGDGGAALAAALARSERSATRLAAAKALGEVDSPAGRAALVEVAAPDAPDERLFCAAVEALGALGDVRGIDAAVARLEQRRSARRIYAVLCQVTHRGRSGFAQVPPSRWVRLTPRQRYEVVHSIGRWWKAMRPRGARGLTLERLRAAGVRLPEDPRSKAAVTALIGALTVDERTLRYAALDELEALIGPNQHTRLFKCFTRKAGGDLGIRVWEPPSGFRDRLDTRRLRETQARRAAALRAWWTKVRDRAQWRDGRWVVT